MVHSSHSSEDVAAQQMAIERKSWSMACFMLSTLIYQQFSLIVTTIDIISISWKLSVTHKNVKFIALFSRIFLCGWIYRSTLLLVLWLCAQILSINLYSMARLLPTPWVCMALADLRNNDNSPGLCLEKWEWAVSSVPGPGSHWTPPPHGRYEPIRTVS